AQPGARPAARQRVRPDPRPAAPLAPPAPAARVQRGRARRHLHGHRRRECRPRRGAVARPRAARDAGRARARPARVMRSGVPVVDLAPFLGGGPGERSAVARAIGHACEEIGFFTVTGHGVPASLTDGMARISRAFFDLPLSEKRRVARPRPEQSRGYIGIGDENLAYTLGGGATDLKEFFAIGPVDAPHDEYHRRPEAYPSFAPNLWPERPAELRESWTAYYRAMERLAA